jgi:hypothetical protein
MSTGEQLRSEGMNLLAPRRKRPDESSPRSRLLSTAQRVAPPTGGGAHGPGQVERIARLPQGSTEQMLLISARWDGRPFSIQEAAKGPAAVLGGSTGLCV